MNHKLLLPIYPHFHNGLIFLSLKLVTKFLVLHVHNKVTKNVAFPTIVLSCQNCSDWVVRERGQGETPTFGPLCQTGLSLLNSPGAQICRKTVVNQEWSSYGLAGEWTFLHCCIKQNVCIKRSKAPYTKTALILPYWNCHVCQHNIKY